MPFGPRPRAGGRAAERRGIVGFVFDAVCFISSVDVKKTAKGAYLEVFFGGGRRAMLALGLQSDVLAGFLTANLDRLPHEPEVHGRTAENFNCHF